MIRVLTKAHERFIRKNYKKLSAVDIGERLGGIPRGTVTSFLKREKLKVPKKTAELFRQKGIQRRYDAIDHPEDKIIEKYYLILPEKTLAAKVNRSDSFVRRRLKKLGLKIPRKLIEQRKKDSQIKPGNVPLNKGKKQTEFMSKEAIERTKATRFYRGQKVWNEGKDGEIRIRHNHPERNGKPHKYIRISKGVWKELQIYNWEKKNGPVPKKYVLACKNGDTLDCRPSNWYLLSMKKNMQRNSAVTNLPDSYVASLLTARKPHLREAVLATPELIELKRKTILFRRKLKSNGTK